MRENGLLIVLSGFSGSGKGTIMKELLSRYPEQYALSISATTRQPRAGEAEGREYFFKTKEEFLRMIEQDELLEYAQYVDNYYGTPKAYVREQLKARKNVILEIEIQGALKIREQFPETLLLFVTPPSAEILKDRLAGRGTETKEVIHSRLARAVGGSGRLRGLRLPGGQRRPGCLCGGSASYHFKRAQPHGAPPGYDRRD